MDEPTASSIHLLQLLHYFLVDLKAKPPDTGLEKLVAALERLARSLHSNHHVELLWSDRPARHTRIIIENRRFQLCLLWCQTANQPIAIDPSTNGGL